MKLPQKEVGLDLEVLSCHDAKVVCAVNMIGS